MVSCFVTVHHFASMNKTAKSVNQKIGAQMKPKTGPSNHFQFSQHNDGSILVESGQKEQLSSLGVGGAAHAKHRGLHGGGLVVINGFARGHLHMLEGHSYFSGGTGTGGRGTWGGGGGF